MKSGIQQFRDWIKRKGFNQRDTADFFGWSESAISQYLSGDRAPELANAVKIEEETGIPARAWLLTDDDKSVSGSPKRKIHAA